MVIAICDDNPSIFPEVERICQDYLASIQQPLIFQSFDSAQALKSYCAIQNNPLDLLLLDIEMPETSGIQSCQDILTLKPSCQIAYHTNYLGYATDVYETAHCYFILKEELASRFPHVIQKVLQKQAESKAHIVIEGKGSREIVYKNKILYIERKRRISYIVLDDDTVIETYLSFNELLEMLHSLEFVRCHNSFIISFSKAVKYTRSEIILNNNQIIPISRTYVKEVRESFGRWSGTQL